MRDFASRRPWPRYRARRQHYRARAEETLSRVEQVSNPELRKTLLEMADTWELMAAYADWHPIDFIALINGRPQHSGATGSHPAMTKAKRPR